MVVLRRARLRFTAVALVTLVASLAAPTAQDADDAVRTVRVSAERFTFTPSEIRVPADVPVRIELKSEDTDHGFRIVGTDVDVVIPKRSRGAAVVTVTLAEGEYTFECSQICGAGHAFMRGVIIASAEDGE